MQQMPNAKALSHGRDTTIDVLGRQPSMFSAGKASSSVTFALKYWVFGFWNTLPTSGVSRSIGTVSTSSPHVVWLPANAPWKNEGMSPLATRV